MWCTGFSFPWHVESFWTRDPTLHQQVDSYPLYHQGSPFIFFLQMKDIPLDKHITFYICSAFDEHLGCFYFGAVMNSAAMDIHGHFFI